VLKFNIVSKLPVSGVGVDFFKKSYPSKEVY